MLDNDTKQRAYYTERGHDLSFFEGAQARVQYMFSLRGFRFRRNYT